MAASGKHPSHAKLRFSWQGLRRFILNILKGLAVLTVAFVTIYQLAEGRSNPAGVFNSVFIIAMVCASFAYLIFVSSRVRLRFPGIDEGDTALGRGASGQGDDVVTIQVVRLDSDAVRVEVVNDTPLPVLRAETSVEVIQDHLGSDTPPAGDLGRISGTPFSIPAHSTKPASLSRAFNHVGIFWLRSAGVRVYSLLGLLSRVRGTPGQWRVRVVPNIYRLSYGIPRERKAIQDSLGIPETPADALDYDRVRDYRPGDPLKTIHWKLVAHSQGELYTKLFETPTITAMTLMLDPFGAEVSIGSIDAAYHLHDTMLEGGLSLIEHARENGIPGDLRFIDRSGSLVRMSWAGPGLRGQLVEMAERPLGGQKALQQSIASIRSLQSGHAGYVIFATSGLTSATVGALIACHRSGVSLLVVHALPTRPKSLRDEQRSFDMRLRDALIGVIELDDGPQIAREVIES